MSKTKKKDVIPKLGFTHKKTQKKKGGFVGCNFLYCEVFLFLYVGEHCLTVGRFEYE